MEDQPKSGRSAKKWSLFCLDSAVA